MPDDGVIEEDFSTEDRLKFLIVWLVTLMHDGEEVQAVYETMMQLAGEDNLDESTQNLLAEALTEWNERS